MTISDPKIGLGTWQNTDSKQCAESVSTSLNMGYRHVDTAQAYGNEEYVGNGIRRSDVSRDEVFLATKVWKDRLTYNGVLNSTERSLDRLGFDYVDILYVHWPAETYDPEATLPAFEDLRKEGRIRNIGVSNFTPQLLDEARRILNGSILANQVEMHPLLQQGELVEYTQNHGIKLVAYSPLARGRVFDVPELIEVGEKHNATPAQVSLAWLMSIENVHPIPKATSEDHIRENYESLSLELDSEDIEEIESIEDEQRVVNPSFAPDW